MKLTHDGILFDPDDLDAPAYETTASWSFRRMSLVREGVIDLVTVDEDGLPTSMETLVW